jgi:hypothetical protein
MEVTWRRISILLLILFTFLASATWLHAQTPTPPSNVNRIIPHFPRRPGFPRQVAHAMRRAEAARLPAVAANVVWVTCPPEAQSYGALCGNVAVPLDRRDPSQGTINIYFELYLHSGSGPAESAFLGNFGGPGLTTTGVRSYFLSIFGSILDVHDMLLIDDRGRGSSDLIVCNDLQYGNTTFDQAWQTAPLNWGKRTAAMARVTSPRTPMPSALPLAMTRSTITAARTAAPM